MLIGVPVVVGFPSVEIARPLIVDSRIVTIGTAEVRGKSCGANPPVAVFVSFRLQCSIVNVSLVETVDSDITVGIAFGAVKMVKSSVESSIEKLVISAAETMGAVMVIELFKKVTELNAGVSAILSNGAAEECTMQFCTSVVFGGSTAAVQSTMGFPREFEKVDDRIVRFCRGAVSKESELTMTRESTKTRFSRVKVAADDKFVVMVMIEVVMLLA